MKALFLPCLLDGLSAKSASIRFRAQWPAKYWPDADCYDGSQRLYNYDVFIFQKLYLGQQARDWAKGLRALGKLLAFDLCDADWLFSETHRERLLYILPQFHFAVVPTEPLQDWVSQWLPTRVIPDRLDLELHQERKVHRQVETPSLIWFGNSANLVTLELLWPEIERLGLPVTILSDKIPENSRQIRWVQWTLEGANEEIARHDVALNPKLDTGHFRYKSHNKTITAWALGVPVASSVEELHRYLDYEARVQESEKRLEEVHELWDVRLSAAEWSELVKERMR